MWTKLALGGCIGLAVGHFVEPGYTVWLVVGAVAAYVADLWHERDKVRKERQVDM